MSMVSEMYDEELEVLHMEIFRLRSALEFVQAWKFPETGLFWDDEKTLPMSYGAAYGSKGERNYMKAYIAKVLAE
ncbi:MAG: hypothetical protein EOO61_03300 [Hymenobacter sp.]|nr:MAG: hypothetical protein EOO61_03300 [Hymenobacter sp.]